MSDPATAFERLIGRQPTDEERQRLYRIRDALGLGSNDALWLILIALDHYQELYGRIPGRIGDTVRDKLQEFGTAADKQAQASMAETQKALTRAVADSAAKIAHNTALKERRKWSAYAACALTFCVTGLSLVAVYGFNYSRDLGRYHGYAAGYNDGIAEARDEVAAASWANTPEGKLAYGLAQEGSLRALATCSAPGWERKIRENGRMICVPYSITAEGGVHGWFMTPGTEETQTRLILVE